MKKIYKYSFSRHTLSLTTIYLTIFLALGIGLYFLYEGGYLSAWFFSFIVALVALMSLSIPRRILVDDEGLHILCLLDITELHPEEIASVRQVEKQELRGYVPYFGGYGFFELTPWQLAFVLSLDMQQMKEQDELSLFVCCKREKLLSYLFDVEESETVLKTKHVSGWQGYLMMDIHKPDRVRNVFQFHPETKEARLVFDNRLCVASLREKEKGKLIHLCWSPSVFAAIDKGGERTAPAYLLASDAALLHGYAMKQIAECFAGTPVEERVIGIHVGDNVYEALSFVCYYVRNVQDEYLVIPERKDGMVILETPKWNPIRQANFVASLNKMAVDQAKKRYPEMEVPNERPFTCLSFARKSFVYFPDLKVYQEVFLKMYLGLVRLQEVHLLG